MRQYGIKITTDDIDASTLFDEPGAENFVITCELKIFADGIDSRVVKELETLVKDKEDMAEGFGMDPNDPKTEVIHELFQKGILQISKCYRDI